MAIPAQQLSLATVPPMPVMKQTSPPCTTSYLTLSDTFLNIGLIIGEDINAQIGKNRNNKFYLHNSSYRNREYLADFSLAYLNTKFQKRERKLLTPIQITLKHN